MEIQASSGTVGMCDGSATEVPTKMSSKESITKMQI